MNIMTTRTAPAGARFSRPSASHLATVDTMLARAAALGIGGRMAASASDIASSPAEPAPAAPITPADTAARLDAQDVQLADHEARIAGLEQRLPPPAADTGAQAATPVASAVATASAARMICGAEIYSRMNARSTDPKAPASAAAAAPAPAMIQTSSGRILNARAIHDRHNAVAAARVGRHR